MMGKGNQQPPPAIAGVNYINFTTNETNQPHTYFAGARLLNVSWIMNPIIAYTQATPSSSGGGK